MYAFDYHRATSAADAVQSFSRLPDPRFLAGGQTLLASLKMRLAQPGTVIDLGRLPELQGIRSGPHGTLTLGAMSTHAEVESSAVVREVLPALAELAGSIGDPLVRHMGTLGGSLANSDPAADWPAALLALDGVVQTDRRSIPADAFFQGLFTTALEADELLLSVTLRAPRRAAYAKFKHPASRFALVGVFVADFGDTVRVAVTGAAACAFRWEPLERALTHTVDPAQAMAVALDAGDFNADLQATADYRAQLVRVMASRAVQRIAA